MELPRDDKPNEEIEKIEILSTDNEQIKSYGELLTNESSITIMQLILNEDLTANQISQKAMISIQLVKYHLNKMQELGIVKISKIGKNVKSHDMKFYRATKFAIVIVPPTVSEKAKESKPLVRSLKSIYRFAGIAIAGIVAWFSTLSLQDSTIEETPSMKRSVPEETAEIANNVGFGGEFFWPIIITISVVGISLLIVESLRKFYKNKSQKMSI